MLHVSAHHAGWPVARGGSQMITEAMAAYFRSLGGEIRTGWNVTTLEELPSARAYLFDTSPRRSRPSLATASRRVTAPASGATASVRPRTSSISRSIVRSRGPTTGAAAPGLCTLVARSKKSRVAEARIWRESLPARPFLLVGQQSLCDPSRAPAGRHTAWIYAHVPHAFAGDATAVILDADRALRPRFPRNHPRHSRHAARRTSSAYNANYIGGDIIGGVQDWRQMFTRPVARWNPYSTPAPDLFLCSASTPPGAGVHGMCGYWAAPIRAQTRVPPN